MAEYKFTPAAAEEAQLTAAGCRSQTVFLLLGFFLDLPSLCPVSQPEEQTNLSKSSKDWASQGVV